MQKIQNIKKLFNKNNSTLILLKSSVVVFFCAIFILIFFLCHGEIYFYQSSYASKFDSYEFAVHAINVGQGDCFVVKLPENKTIVIDSGSAKNETLAKSYIKRFLKNNKIKSIDYLVLTHTDEDHIGNAKMFIENFEVKNVVRPKLYSLYEIENGLNEEDYNVSDSIIYNDVIEKIISDGINFVFASENLTLDEKYCDISFLSPSENKYSNSNDYSAVIKITYHEKSFLFMGDATTNIEENLINKYGESLKSDVLKIGHHGSNTSTNEEFLKLVNPSYAIVSVGENSYGLPNVDVMNLLYDNNIKTLRTDRDGSFAFGVFDEKLNVALYDKVNCDLPLVFSTLTILMFFTLKLIEDNRNNIILNSKYIKI